MLSWRRQYPSYLYPGLHQFDASIGQPREVDVRFLLDYRNPFSLAQAVRELREWRAEVVVLTWATTFSAPFYLVILMLLRAMTRRPAVVALCHNVLPHERRMLDRLLSAAVLRNVDAAIVHSAKEATTLNDVAPDTPAHHLELPEFGPVAHNYPAGDAVGKDAERVVLFFGFVRPYKGLEHLIEAMALLDRRLDVSLVVAGEFWEPRPRYDQLIRDLQLGDRVRVVDRYISDAEVPEVFAAADVAVLPYVEATQSAVVRLAFANGTPVISTDVGGISEVVAHGRNGLLVPPRSPDALAKAIETYFRSDLGPGMRSAIARRSRSGWRDYRSGLRLAAVSRRHPSAWRTR